MVIQQFEDAYLSHFSYAVVHDGEAVLIDPSRNPQPYYEFVSGHSAIIKAVIETHLHADFVSSHVEISKKTGAEILMHPAAAPFFSFRPFEDGTAPVRLGDWSLKAIYTPGHSPDSICILLTDSNGNTTTVFTGDTLFIGDVGRPDLRESSFGMDASRETLARKMYHSLRDKILTLGDPVIVYPAHGSGSLCGKHLSSQSSSTIGNERLTNVALQHMSENDFVEMLLSDQPMVPKYFSQSVELNRRDDIAPFQQALDSVSMKSAPIRSPSMNGAKTQTPSALIIDVRPADVFKQSHLTASINIPNDKKFETWLGTIISPNENFILVGASNSELLALTERLIKIGCEKNLLGVKLIEGESLISSELLDAVAFTTTPDQFTIVDVRTNAEREAQTIFENSIHIPLHQLHERLGEIPRYLPVVTHCGGGNRGAIAASILQYNNMNAFDLGASVKDFIHAAAADEIKP